MPRIVSAKPRVEPADLQARANSRARQAIVAMSTRWGCHRQAGWESPSELARQLRRSGVFAKHHWRNRSVYEVCAGEKCRSAAAA